MKYSQMKRENFLKKYIKNKEQNKIIEFTILILITYNNSIEELYFDMKT
jgi:hypothetical protein